MRAIIRRKKTALKHAKWEDTGERYELASTAKSLAAKRAHPAYDVMEIDAARVRDMCGATSPAAKTSASARPVARG